MRSRPLVRLLLACSASVLVTACGGSVSTPPGSPPTTPTASPAPEPPRSEIPTASLAQVLEAHLKGLGHMERYTEYPQAVEQFRIVHRLAPDWIPGSINLAIALLNTSGAESEANKGMGGQPENPAARANPFEEALALLDDVQRRDPDNLYAHYCRGIILEYLGRIDEAHRAFRIVTEKDPADAHAWYRTASTLPAPDDASPEARKKQAQEQIALLTRALELNPYLVPALYRLMMAYGLAGQPEKRTELLDLWKRLNPKQNAAAPGDPAETVYGEMGKYATIIDWSPAPRVGEAAVRPPRFDVPKRLDVALGAGRRWRSDNPLARPHQADVPITSFDADGDGRLDLFLSGAVESSSDPKQTGDVLLLNRGEGRFEDATAAAGLPVDPPSTSAAAGDFDADGRIDLFLPGVNRLYRNAGGRFEEVTDQAGLSALTTVPSVAARWLDLDQDGDLDLYILTRSENPDGGPPASRNLAYRNDGVPPTIAGRPRDNWAPIAVAPQDLGATAGLTLAFTPWPPEGADALGAGEHAHRGIAWLDLDADRDLDLLSVSADGAAPVAVLNDRLGRFHAMPLPDVKTSAPARGVLAADFDRDGRTDLAVLPESGKVALWRSRPPRPGEAPQVGFEFYPTNAHDWAVGHIVDLDLDGALDLVGLRAGGGEPTPLWARNAGNGLNEIRLALGPDSTAPLCGLAVADLAADPLPDLLLFRSGEGPFLAVNLGNDHRWLALDLSGRWKAGFDRARSNPHGLGVKVQLQGPNLKTIYDHLPPTSNGTQSVGPIVLGLGASASADLLRLTWPDGVMQCELNQNADQRLVLAETNRKTGSCPVLFSFDGERFVCIGDFLGGGGLGYLVRPGVDSEPDRDESVAISSDQLRPVGAALRLSIVEPMDEVAYLDHLALDVIDRPEEVQVAPDERFAPGGNRPSGRLLAWRRAIEPVRVTDLNGVDLGSRLRHFDRRTADTFRKRAGWIGYAEEHGLVLEFGDRVSAFRPGDRLALMLAGWVEYPYSQTNYAAAVAGVALQPPVLERRRSDGSWEVIEADPGYPAGLPRLTALELTGKLTGPNCTLRLRTNMECYYDQAFVAVLDTAAPVRTTALGVARAGLGVRGYLRESSPDGRDPLLYDYDRVDPAPLAHLTGNLTRLGEVTELLRDDDDRLCVIGPGDEVRLEFDAGGLPDLPPGWRRDYVLRAVGYCKDADPFTAASDTVGPLPYRGMPSYPCPDRPSDPGYEAYLRTYQTRSVRAQR